MTIRIPRPFRMVPAALASLALLNARADSGKTGFSVLNTPPPASAAGMAGAVLARAGDPAALYYNPAGLALLEEESAALHSHAAFQDVTHEAVSYTSPARGGGWGVTAGILNVGGLTKTVYDPSSPDRFSTGGTLRAGDQYLAGAVGRRLGLDDAWGVGVKAVREQLDARSAYTLAADAGWLHRVDDQWQLAAALRQLGTPAKFSSKTVSPPARAQAGVLYAPEEWAQWEVDAAQELQGAGEALVGGRFSWDEKEFLRVGYRYRFHKNGLGALSGATAGLGGKWGAFSADYAFQPFGDLGSEHRFTLSWRLGTPKFVQPVGRPHPKFDY